MTPASWGVRRMLFGHSSHSRWLSCSRRWFAEYSLPPTSKLQFRGLPITYFATSTLQNKLLVIIEQQKVGFMIIFAA